MSELQIDQQVIYQNCTCGMPVIGRVTRVTKTQARVTVMSDNTVKEVGPFKRNSHIDRHDIICGKYDSGHVFSDLEKLHELEKSHFAHESRKDAKIKKHLEEREQREKEREKRMIATKKAIMDAGGLETVVDYEDEISDDVTFLVANVPHNPDVRNPSTKCIMNIRVLKEDEMHRDGETVEIGFTYTKTNGGGFSSIGTTYHKTHEEAVLAAINSVYHSW